MQQTLPWNAKVLDAEATAITGIRPVEKWVSRDGKRCGLRKLILRITPLDGRKYMRQSALGKIYEPRADIAKVAPPKAKNLTGGLVCEGCGVPRSNGTAGTCRRCYLNKAKQRHEQKQSKRSDVLDELHASAAIIEFWEDRLRSAAWHNSDSRTRNPGGHRERTMVHFDPDPDEHP